MIIFVKENYMEVGFNFISENEFCMFILFSYVEIVEYWVWLLN